MFDSSSSSDVSRTPSPVRVYSPKQKIQSPKQKIFEESVSTKKNKKHYFLVFFFSIIPMLFYLQEYPQLNCANGLTKFCRPCPKNSKCSISTFSCKEKTMQFHSQCIPGNYSNDFIEEVYNSVENSLINNKPIETIINETFSYDNLVTIMISKGKYAVDSQNNIMKVTKPSFVTYLLLSLTVAFFILTLQESFVLFK